MVTAETAGTAHRGQTSERDMTKKRFAIRASVYDRKGRLLTVGENSYNKTHPLQAKYAVQVGLDDKIYLHAEIAALTKLKRGQVPYKIVVERYKDDGTSALAKPCLVCDAAIRAHGITLTEWTE